MRSRSKQSTSPARTLHAPLAQASTVDAVQARTYAVATTAIQMLATGSSQGSTTLKQLQPANLLRSRPAIDCISNNDHGFPPSSSSVGHRSNSITACVFVNLTEQSVA